jgi:hypothetical protein
MKRLFPLALMLLSPVAQADWQITEPEQLVDQLSVAIALKAHDVDLQSASALVAATTEGPLIKRYDRIRGREHLETTEATTVALMSLDSYAAPGDAQTWRIESDEICTRIRGAQVPASHARLTAVSPFGSESQSPGAQIFRGSSEEGEEVLTWLRPGETVTMVQAESVKTQRRVERIELRQRDRRLTLTRDDQSSEACYQRQ